MNNFNPYANPTMGNMNGQGTFVPGMTEQESAPGDAMSPMGVATPATNEAPVMGFLYSVSNNGKTEFWPIHLGRNIIGRGSDVDICLNEASVSERHVQISVKRMTQTHTISAMVQDIGSKNGLVLNGEELGYEGHPCKDGDVLLIGNAYKCLLILVDSEQRGLGVSENFKALEDNSMPQFGGASPYDRNYGDGTTDLNGIPPTAAGGTMILQ